MILVRRIIERVNLTVSTTIFAIVAPIEEPPRFAAGEALTGLGSRVGHGAEDAGEEEVSDIHLCGLCVG